MAAIVDTARRDQWRERLGVQVAAVIANRADAGGLALARAQGIATEVVDHKSFATRALFDEALAAAIKGHDPDAKPALVVLAGFMRVLTAGFVAEFDGRLVNIHPSLLPSFPGLESQKQALDYGVKFAGCTVHFVDENLDAGPIILQSAVPVLDSDDEHTLSARILKEEHRIYTQAVKIILEGNYKIAGRRVLHPV